MIYFSAEFKRIIRLQGTCEDDCIEFATETFLSNPKRFSLSPSRIQTLVSKKVDIEINDPTIKDAINTLTEKDFANIDDNAIQLAQTTGVDSDVAFALAFESYAVGASQCREMLCSTQEDIFVGASLGNMFKDSDDIEWLDMELVSNYALDMEQSGGIDAAIAYGVALDTFLADPDAFRDKFGLNSAICEITEKDFVVSVTPDKNFARIAAASDDDYYGASLNRLFRLPKDFVGGDKDLNDIDLVTAYGEDLELNGGVDPAVAYGIALDAFIADPVAFRMKFGCSVVSMTPNTGRASAPATKMTQMSKAATLAAECNEVAMDAITLSASRHTSPAKTATTGPKKAATPLQASNSLPDLKDVAEIVLEKNVEDAGDIAEPRNMRAGRARKAVSSKKNAEAIEQVQKDIIDVHESTPSEPSRRRGRATFEQEDETQPQKKRSTRGKKAVEPVPELISKAKRGKAASVVKPPEVASDEEIALAILCDG